MRIIIILLAICSSLIVSAQDLKVVVKDSQEPLPYAYIGLNGRLVAITDSVGVGYIKRNKISLGDTISAYYVGTSAVYALYSELMHDKGLCELIYSDPVFTIDVGTAIVEASAEMFFEKSLRNSYIISVNGVIEGEFEARFYSEDSTCRKISGEIKAENKLRGKGIKTFAQYGYFHLITDIKTDDDTIAIKQQLINITRDALGSISDMLLSQSGRTITNKSYYTKYGYIGQQNGVKKFRVTYKPKSNDAIIFQAILFIDEQRRSLIRTETSLVLPDLDFTNAIVNIDYNEYLHKKKQKMLIQKNIDYTIKSQGLTKNIQIRNVKFYE